MHLDLKIVDKINSIENVAFAYLFGSYAKDEQTEESDIDVAIYLNSLSLDTELQVTYEISKLTHKNVDIMVLNRVKNIFLLENIFKDGIILKDSEKRIDFELTKQHDILDYKAFRRYIDAA